MGLTQAFEFPLRAGRLRMALPCTAPGNGLAQARAVAAALPIWAALESWLGQVLPCPQPLSADAACEADLPSLSLAFDPASALAGGSLHVPWAHLTPARPCPPALPMAWPKVAARLCLQTLLEAQLDAAGLVPGAVLLLPASFAGPWQVSASAEGNPPPEWHATCLWSPQDAQLQAQGRSVSQTRLADWSVWLADPVSLELRTWMGLKAPATAALASSLVLHRRGEVAALGRLLPCGTGYGLRIETVTADASELAAAAWT